MATLKDVAAAAQVSTGTVSRVLNGKADEVGIAKATQDRVMEAVRELNYIPNRHARNLRLRHRRDTVCLVTVGPLAQLIISPFFSPVINALETHAAEVGLRLNYARFEQNSFGKKTRIRASDVLSPDVKAVVTIGSLPEDWVCCTAEAGLRLVGIEPYSTAVRRSVYVDNVGVMQQAVTHMVRMGCRRIAMMCPVRSDGYVHPPFWERVQAFIQFSREMSVEFVVRRVESRHEDDATAAFLGAQRLIREVKMDGLICPSDLWAAESLRAARATGRTVPDDLKIMGVDNLYWAKYTSPPLSTVEISADAMGQAVINLLMAEIDESDAKVVTIPGRLVVRETTMARRI